MQRERDNYSFTISIPVWCVLMSVDDEVEQFGKQQTEVF